MENRLIGKSLLRAFLAERVLTALTRIVDILMIWFLATDPEHGLKGIAYAFLFVTPLYFIFCMSIVYVSDLVHKRKGLDVTGLETLRELEHAQLQKKQWFKRLVQQVLKSRKLIFWVGSWFYLDPDYVTLLLRKKCEGYVSTALRITLPSVLISMTVWLGIYWAGFQGYEWAKWLVK